jgi:hypothetical protein
MPYVKRGGLLSFSSNKKSCDQYRANLPTLTQELGRIGA